MKGKVVIITGASSGIGRSLAFVYGGKGSKVVIAARSRENLEKVEKELQDLGIEVLSVITDVSMEEDCKQLIAATVNRFGRVDILINNAGISMRALFKDLDLNVIRRLMDTNFWGTVYCTKYALPYLLATKGSVVGVISVAGHIGLPGRTGYSASKFAIRGFLNTLRVENMRTGLHVLVVAPGFTTSNIRKAALKADGSIQGETPRNEASMMSPDKVGRRIYRAVKNRRRQLILTFFEGKLAVFLKQWFPWLVDRQIYLNMAREPDSPFK